jgi:peptide/nickel transport system substrate-binding protein
VNPLLRIAALVLLSILVAACPASDPPPVTADGDPAPGGTVVIGELGDVMTWNPYLAEDQTTAEILSLVFPSLAIEQVDYQLHPPSFAPHLATHWEWSDDGLELVFHLDPDAVWTDGVSVTADDVLFSWRVQTSPEIAWSIAGAKDFIETVEALDTHTVRFRFTRAYPYQLLDANEGLIIPAHAWSGIPFERWRETSWRDHLVSAGPFRVARHQPQQELVLVRFDRYWKPNRPLLDRVVMRPVPSRKTLLNQLLAGTVDVVNGVAPADAGRVLETPERHLVVFADRGYSQIRWNLRRPLLSDPAVRRALTMAIDRGLVVDVVYQGFARPSVGPVLSNMWAFNRDLEPLPHDPDAARSILAAAGWGDSDGDGLLDRDGVAFEFEILANTENELRQDIALLVEENLSRVGIRAAPRFVEWGTLLALENSGEYDAIVSRWIEPTLIDLEELWHTPPDGIPTLNSGGYSNPEVDRLLAEAARASTFSEQKPLFDRIQELIVADQPYTFLAETSRLVGVNDRVRGAEFNDASPYFNLEDWYVNTSPDSD